MISRRMHLRQAIGAIAARTGFAKAQGSGKVVVLTFDDAVKSHRTFVAPLLKELGFKATFFITHNWMADTEHFLNWQEVAEIHQMGFEIGNHSWTHVDFSMPRYAARLAGELALVENELRKAGVPQPVSFGWTGNGFGPEALKVLAERGYRFARRGMQPEVKYGQARVGPAYQPARHHPLLIPTAGDAYPEWTLEHFVRVVSQAADGRIPVLQFHGVPDPVHPWVHTPPERFREYMSYLKQGGFRVIGLRDLADYVDAKALPADPLLQYRHQIGKGPLLLPLEVEATRAELPSWLRVMAAHRYSAAEAAEVCGLDEAEVKQRVSEMEGPPPRQEGLAILPYPGGRHPRIGFLEGAINPLRGTKASVFLPWDPASYVLVDLPEAISSNLGLTFLAHTHFPTIWNQRGVTIENVDWQRTTDGGLSSRWSLPEGIVFGASIRPSGSRAEMELWLENGTRRALQGLHSQVCVQLKGARGFSSITNENKIFRGRVAAVRSADGDRWILTAWEPCRRLWGNAQCPCLHSDPAMPDCAPGETVRARGRLWFYEGREIERELDRAVREQG